MSLHTRSTAAHNAAQPPLFADRDRDIESHLPQVKFIADRLAAKLPPSVDRDDLIGAGVIGLLDAVDKFDPARGVLFKTYAEMRVRGAMLDSLRELDWAPRSMRRRAREVEDAYHKIEQERGRPAEEQEVAAELGLSLPELQLLLGELRGLSVTSLDSDENEDGHFNFRQAPDDLARTPLALYEQAETQQTLAAAIDLLPKKERQMIALYYVEELTMKEIGLILGVTESRISQLRTQAIIRLRAALAARLRPLALN
ncbi:MAG: FliA/WhiG family RNA polymerase sigma factor [Acidobacteriota bacterium]|nr:FliA/WhiG family RNA polymerase sigma factor [Acidobacteriota bacterium]